MEDQEKNTKKQRLHTYNLVILEQYLDFLGHVNNAHVLTILESARWDMITNEGLGLSTLQELQVAPVILEINIRYLREIRLRDKIFVQTSLIGHHSGKVGKLEQLIFRNSNELTVSATLVYGVMNLQERRLQEPPKVWVDAFDRLLAQQSSLEMS